jgi:hypothetical protein
LTIQGRPFDSLPSPEVAEFDLLFVEEIAQHTCPEWVRADPTRWYEVNNGRYKGKTEPCYGAGHWKAFGGRPVLCSGTVVGNRAGLDRFLAVLVQEFVNNYAKDNQMCHAPVTDQWTMNYLYYNGLFGRHDRTRTAPWGTGPVLTIGHACINKHLKPSHSQTDLIFFDNATGLILNEHEGSGSQARIAPVVHQYDRCHGWIQPFLKQHKIG